MRCVRAAGRGSAMNVTIIQGHPDPAPGHFGPALAEAYAEGAEQAGHAVRRVEVAQLQFPLLRSQQEFEHGQMPETLEAARDAVAWAEHPVIVYPLWLGTMPALLKGLFEQVFRPGFAFEYGEGGRWQRGLKGRSARVIVTMGMPAFIYRWYFRAHSLRSLERNILSFVGIRPVRSTIVGLVAALGEDKRARWLERLRGLGARAV